MPDWINAIEKPEPYVDVLCCCEINDTHIKQLVLWHDGKEWATGYKITHWQPLPAYPSEIVDRIVGDAF